MKYVYIDNRYILYSCPSYNEAEVLYYVHIPFKQGQWESGEAGG